MVRATMAPVGEVLALSHGGAIHLEGGYRPKVAGVRACEKQLVLRRLWLACRGDATAGVRTRIISGPVRKSMQKLNVLVELDPT